MTVESAAGPDVLVVLPSSHSTGAGACAAAFLRWAGRSQPRPPRAYALAGGALKGELRDLGVKVVESPRQPLRTVEKALAKLDREREARAVRKTLHWYLFTKPPHPDLILAFGAIAAARVVRYLPAGTRLVTYCSEDGPALDALLDESTRAHLVRATDGWVAAHDGVARDLVERGVRPDSVVTIPPFIDDPEPTRVRAADLRRSLGLGPDDVLVGGVGPSDWTAGPDLFLRTAALVARTHPDLPVRFAWIGAPDDGPTRWILDHDVTHAGLGDRVVLTGSPGDGVPWAGAMDVLLATSRVDELTPPVLAAGAMGRPVVGFEGGALGQLARTVGGAPGVSLVAPLDVAALAERVATLVADDAVRRAGAELISTGVARVGLADSAAPRLWDALGRVTEGRCVAAFERQEIEA